LGINALCLLLGVVVAIAVLKYAVPRFGGDSSSNGPSGMESFGTKSPASPVLDNVLEARILAEVDKAWAGHRFFALLKEADPEAADQVRARLVAMARHALQTKGEFLAADLADIGDLAAEAAMSRIARASDSAVNDFAAAALRQMHALRDLDPKYCLIYLFPRAFSGERIPASALSADSQRMLDVLAQILDSALHAPQAPPTAARANAALSKVLGSLIPSLEKRYHGREPVVAAFAAMSNPSRLPASDHAVVADVAIRFYEEIMTLPLEERSQALRLLFAGPGAAK
ncbi:MAG: hypothetical protein AB7E32_16860, partial [Desulfovibrio sp.]